ncbi:MAG: hypothetical protein HZC28_09240 [Spirochaetes bacterium]|nr:hypothetical protein [Spirochaetota bacterium]
MVIEYIVIGLVVALAAVYLIRFVYRELTITRRRRACAKDGKPAGCDCSKCGANGCVYRRK